MKTYKIIYYRGESFDIRTKVEYGRLHMQNGMAEITPKRGGKPFVLSGLRSVRLFRMNGLGRMLEVDYDGGRIFLTVTRFCIGGQLAIVNFLGTGELGVILKSLCR